MIWVTFQQKLKIFFLFTIAKDTIINSVFINTELYDKRSHGIWVYDVNTSKFNLNLVVMKPV